MNYQLNNGLVSSPGDPFDTMTILIREELIVRFSFWMADQIQNGIRLRGELFQYVARFDTTQRQQAFDLASRLTQAGKPAVITVKDSHYTVWESLRSSPIASPQPSGHLIDMGANLA